MKNKLIELDSKFINFSKNISVPLARFGLFLVYFWFGFLKLVGLSPASELVKRLFNETMPIMSFETFLICFGVFECLIGILFLIKGMERVVIPLLFFHMVTTFMPLYFLHEETWSGVMVPTLEGQYIIKNILIISATILIASNLKPIKETQNA